MGTVNTNSELADKNEESTAALADRTELWHLALGLLFVLLLGEASLLFRRKQADEVGNQRVKRSLDYGV